MKPQFSKQDYLTRDLAKSSYISSCNFSWRSVITALLIVFLIGSVYAGSAFAENKDLDKLEMKFFHHTYPKEEMLPRLERLEKMFFGEGKEGSASERLSKLKRLVPDLDEVELEKKKPAVKPPVKQSKNTSSSQDYTEARAPERNEPRADAGTTYPAITAIERKKLGSTHEDDAVGTRLARLEKKMFGQVSTSNDFTDRMDRLKAATGVDIARQAPNGTDWAADDVVINYPTPTNRRARQTIGRPKYGEDGKSFSGKNLREDMRKAFGNRYPSSGSGYYGMNGSRSGSSSGSGAYGFGRSSSSGSRAGVGLIPNDRTTAFAPPSTGQRYGSSGYPPIAPSYKNSSQSIGSMGLNQKVDLLEAQIFGRSFAKDSLRERVGRLEKTVFPNQRSNASGSLPSRVNKLVSVIPIQPRNLASNNNQVRRQPSQAFPPQGQMPNPNANQPKSRGGLSKVLSAMGNFVTGGFSVGSYPMNGNLVTDPQTGMYLDRSTGNLIDHHTGMVVGRKGLNGYNRLTPGYGYGYGNRSFNNGFSPSINSYGVGGSGIRFGTGFGGVGGMWP